MKIWLLLIITVVIFVEIFFRLPDLIAVTKEQLPYISLLGLLFAIVTFIINMLLSRKQSRKQHSINVLLQSTNSAVLRDIKSTSYAFFPSGSAASLAKWRGYLELINDESDYTQPDHPLKKRESASAISALLNYYEFIALGIATGDLDHDMMKRTLRGIMCNFVYDMRNIIAGARSNNPRILENLVKLFEAWRDPSQECTLGRPELSWFGKLRRKIGYFISP